MVDRYAQNPAVQWFVQRVQEGHSIEQIKNYLLMHGYTIQQADYVTRVAQYVLANQPIPEHPSHDTHAQQTKDKFVESHDPKSANEYFKRFSSMLKQPTLFFSHLYSKQNLAGLNMFAFSGLIMITLGLLFWSMYYRLGLFVYTPSWTKYFLSPEVTAKIGLAFGIIIIVAQPLYFLLIKYKQHELSFKQYVTGLAYAVAPFILFLSLPGFNVIGVFMTLYLCDVAFSRYLKVDKKTLAELGVIYSLGLTIIVLVIMTVVFTAPQPIQNSCNVYPSGVCSVQAVAWNQVQITGINDSFVGVFESINDPAPICSGNPAQPLECTQIITSGAYVFKAQSMTGAFVLVV